MTMLQTEAMLRCKIIGSKQHLSTVINALYDLGVYHITPHIKGRYELDVGEPLADAESLAELLVQIRKVLASFPQIKCKSLPELNKTRLAVASKGIRKLYADFVQLQFLEAELAEKKEALQESQQMQAFFRRNDIHLKPLQQSIALSFFLGQVSKPEQVAAAMPSSTLVKQEGHLIFVVGAATDQARLEQILSPLGFQPFLSKKVNEKEMARQQQQIQALRQAIGKEIPLLTTLERQLQEEVRKQELPLSFATTSSTFIAEGWIPAKDAETVTTTLQTSTNGKIHLELLKADHHDAPPVKFNNKRLLSPFEFFLHLYDLPRYKEIDPTSLLFITFPLFFGFMVGDAGYGLALAVLFLFLRQKIPAARQILNVLLFASIISIFFGMMFGEYFGFEHLGDETGAILCDGLSICLPQQEVLEQGVTHTVWQFPHLINRVADKINVFGYEILSVLVIGALVGFIHLNLGLLFGFINEYASHGWKQALFAKLSWIILEAGIILAVTAKLGLTPFAMWGGVVIALLGTAMLVWGEGVQGIIEIPALFSNMLSYMRLGAVGLAGVGLAMVVNENLGLPMIEKGGIWVVLGILVMLLGHAVNLLLSVIGPFLHGARLHYVEFFSKFFRGGGVLYSPFASKKKQTEA